MILTNIDVPAIRQASLLPGASATSIVVHANANTPLDGCQTEELLSPLYSSSLNPFLPHDHVQETLASTLSPPRDRRAWCKFQLEDYLFDLCPLLAPERYPTPTPHNFENVFEREGLVNQGRARLFKIVVRRESPPTVTYTYYFMSLGIKLDMSSEWWKGRQVRMSYTYDQYRLME